MSNLRLLLWIFYKPLLVFNLLFTGCALFVLAKNGLVTLPILITLKILGYVTCVGYQYFSAYYYYYYYYRNAGYLVRRLYCYTFAIDFAAFSLFATGLTLLIHAPAKG